MRLEKIKEGSNVEHCIDVLRKMKETFSDEELNNIIV